MCVHVFAVSSRRISRAIKNYTTSTTPTYVHTHIPYPDIIQTDNQANRREKVMLAAGGTVRAVAAAAFPTSHPSTYSL